MSFARRSAPLARRALRLASALAVAEDIIFVRGVVVVVVTDAQVQNEPDTPVQTQ